MSSKVNRRFIECFNEGFFVSIRRESAPFALDTATTKWLNAQRPCNRRSAFTKSDRANKRGVDLSSDALLFVRVWYDTPDNAIGYAMHCSRSHDAVTH
jgi:hypothetical protein